MEVYPGVSYFKDGDALAQGPMNIPLQALAARTDYLYRKLNEVANNDSFATVQMNQANVQASVSDIVYYDTAAQVYKPATTALLSSAISRYESADHTTYAVGLYKGGSSIVTYGVHTFDLESDIPIVTNEAFREGPYYLSGDVAGKLTASPNGVAVYLGTIYKQGSAYIFHMAPQIKDLWEAHIHTKTYLTQTAVGPGDYDFTGYGSCEIVLTAGYTKADAEDYTFTLAGNTMTVLDGAGVEAYAGVIAVDTSYDLLDGSGISFYVKNLTDTTVVLPMPISGRGWRESISTDLVTTGYIYNVGYDAVLSEQFPNTPSNSIQLELNGVMQDNVTDIATGAYTVKPDGIYWLSTVSPLAEDGEYESQKIFKLYSTYTRVGDSGLVTSLEAVGNAVSLIDAAGNPVIGKATGDCRITANLDLTAGVADTPGHNVVKGIEDGQFISGPVIEAVTSGDGILVSTVNGVATISLEATTSYKGSFTDTILLNADQALDPGMTVPYLKLKPYTNAATDPTTEILYSMKVPQSMPAGDYKIAVYFTLFPTEDNNTGGVQTIAMTMTSTILDSRSTVVKLTDVVPEVHAVTSLSLGVGYKAYNPKLYYSADGIVDAAAEPDAINNDVEFGTLNPGDTFTLKLGRAATAFSGSLGILDARWELIKQ